MTSIQVGRKIRLMELALIIAIVALIVALPGCIADSLTLIDRLRAKKGTPARPTLNPFKKIIKSGHDHANLLSTELNKKIGSSCTTCGFTPICHSFKKNLNPVPDSS